MIEECSRKSFKFKLFANKRKSKKLEDELYVFSTIYNHSLALIKRHYKIYGKNPSKYKLQHHLKNLRDKGIRPEWSKLGYSQAQQEVTDRIYKSYDEFFKWCRLRQGVKKSPPKFKPFRKYRSFTLKQFNHKSKTILNEEHGIIKIGSNNYRYNNSRKIEGEVKTVTIKRDSVGDWYIIFSCKLEKGYEPQKIASMTGKSAGFDFGLSCFLTSSDNKRIMSPEYLKCSLMELKTKSKSLSNKAKGSKNRAKARKSLARLHRKIDNQRQDFHFKLAKDLIYEYDYLFFEDLNLQGMKKLWGRKVSDLGLGKFMDRLKFKSIEQKKILHKIDRFYPSSKQCSSCKEIKDDLQLKHRQFVCECGHNMNRDLNAAINILTVGASTVGLDGVSRDSILVSVV